MPDEYVNFLSQTEADLVGFRQGVVDAFDPDNGQNTINVGGAQLLNVPMLNSGEATTLKPGHVVGLLVWKNSWFILGRITPPNSPDFASASVDFAGARGAEFEVTHNAGLPPDDQIVRQIPVPGWADEALVFVSTDMTADNTSAQNNDALFVSSRIDSITGEEMMASVNSGEQKSITASLEAVRINLGAVDNIEVAGRSRTNIATWPGAGSNNRVAISAFAIFRAVVS